LIAGKALIQEDAYVVPNKKNFDLVDSFCWISDTVLAGFQLTVGQNQNHSFAMPKAGEILAATKAAEFRVYFCLPQDKYDNFAVPEGSVDGMIKCFKLSMASWKQLYPNQLQTVTKQPAISASHVRLDQQNTQYLNPTQQPQFKPNVRLGDDLPRQDDSKKPRSENYSNTNATS
jgi:hypothetical protein